MKLSAIFLLLCSSLALGQSGPADPCAATNTAKSSVAISVSSATTTQLVALQTNKFIYVCGYSFTAATGTGATYQFEYGTGTTCGTGTTNLTGAMLGGSTIYTGTGITQFSTVTGNALCLVTGGTSPNAQGFLTYVQQQ